MKTSKDQRMEASIMINKVWKEVIIKTGERLGLSIMRYYIK